VQLHGRLSTEFQSSYIQSDFLKSLGVALRCMGLSTTCGWIGLTDMSWPVRNIDLAGLNLLTTPSTKWFSIHVIITISNDVVCIACSRLKLSWTSGFGMCRPLSSRKSGGSIENATSPHHMACCSQPSRIYVRGCKATSLLHV
jgi:hypothetical protein